MDFTYFIKNGVILKVKIYKVLTTYNNMVCKIKKAWVEIEKEHTTSNKKAEQIVKEHIKEHGCNYYPALIKMEKKVTK